MRRVLIVLVTVIVALGVNAQETEVSGSRKDIRHSGDVVSALLPVAGVAAVLIQEDWRGLKQGVFSAATTFVATTLLKKVVDKRRPDHSDYDSFPSRHAAFAFATSVFIHRRYGWQWAIPCYAASAYISWTRVYGKKHDWWDVAAGAAIGAGSSLIYTTPLAKKSNLTLLPTGSGVYAAISF